MAARGLRCCRGFSLVAASKELLFIAAHGLLIAVASLAGTRRLWSSGSVVVNTVSVALRHADPPRPGIELVYPTLAGGFLATRPPGKSSQFLIKTNFFFHYIEFIG